MLAPEWPDAKLYPARQVLGSSRVNRVLLCGLKYMNRVV